MNTTTTIRHDGVATANSDATAGGTTGTRCGGPPQLSEIASIPYFRSTPLDRFRYELSKCFEESLRMCLIRNENENDDDTGNAVTHIHRYHPKQLLEIFMTIIEWKNLCGDYDKQQHDKIKIRRESNDDHHLRKDESTTTASIQSSSVLLEIITVLKNPITIPRCCSGHVTQVLLFAILVSPRQQSTTLYNRWTPSQSLLLDTIEYLLKVNNNNGHSPIIPSTVYNFVMKQCSFSSPSSTATTTTTITITPNQTNRLLSVVYHFANNKTTSSCFAGHDDDNNNDDGKYYENQRHEFIMVGLCLLQRIDSWDIQQEQQQQQQKLVIHQHSHNKLSGEDQTTNQPNDNNNIICKQCGKPISNSSSSSSPRPKTNNSGRHRLKASNLSDLHDGNVEMHCHSYNNNNSNLNCFYQRRPTYYNNNTEPTFLLSLKKVLKADNKPSSYFDDTGNNEQCTCIVVSRNNNISTASNANANQSSSRGVTQLSKDWSTVRSRAYKKFLSFVQQQQQQQQYQMPKLSANDITTSSSSSTSHHHRVLVAPHHSYILEINDTTLLHRAVALPHCPTWRVCLALLAYSSSFSAGGGGQQQQQPRPYHHYCWYQKIAKLCFEGYLSQQQEWRQRRRHSRQSPTHIGRRSNPKVL